MKYSSMFILIFCFLIGFANSAELELELENKFLNLPVSYDEDDKTKIEIVIDGKSEFYFDIFLKDFKEVTPLEFQKEIKNYNQDKEAFWVDVARKYPEFESLLRKNKDKTREKPLDIMQYIMENSEHLKKEEV